MLITEFIAAVLTFGLVTAEVAIQGDGKFSYHFVVPNPETVMTCENMNFKAVEDLQQTVKTLTEEIQKLNKTTGPVFRGGFPVASGTSTNAKQKCKCSCNADVDFHFEYRDCQDVKDLSPLTLSGVYNVFPVTRVEHLLMASSSIGVKAKYWSVQTENATKVYCELSDSKDYGWTVLQRRTKMDENFNRTWDDYKNGFGEMENGDFWLGLENMHKITNQKFLIYSMRITFWPANNIPIHKDFPRFRVAGEADNYRVSFGSGVGAMNGYLDMFSGGVFTTYDKDNDPYGSANCALDGYKYKYLIGGGWWFKKHSTSYWCGMSNLNAFEPYLYSGGTIKHTEMKIRPVNS